MSRQSPTSNSAAEPIGDSASESAVPVTEEQLLSSHRLRLDLQMALWGSGDKPWDWRAENDTISLSTFADADSAPTIVRMPMLQHFQEIHPSDLHMVMMEWNSHLFNQSEAFDAQFRIRHKDGWQWLRQRGRAIERNSAGLAVRVMGTLRNISEQQRDRRNLELLVSVFDNATEAMCILNATRHVIDSNRAFNDLFNLDKMVLGGKYLADLTHNSRRSLVESILDRAEEDGHWQGEYALEPELDESATAASTRSTWVNVTAVDEGGATSYFMIMAIDITERKQAEEQLKRLARTDPLTHCANRAFFEERLDQAIDHAQRVDETLALLFIDLDRFKQVNDSMGHKAGDDLLIELARRFEASVRATDLVGRWGGDEFVILLTALKSSTEALRVASKLREAVLDPLELEGVSITVSASIGVAMFPYNGSTKSEILERADTAMYQAKSTGRNAIEFYEQGMGGAANETLRLEVALRRAIANEELEVYYQPKVSLDNLKTTSMEALLRWHSEEFGQVSPDVFIPLAEDSGLILDIGRWVMNKACRQIADWQGTPMAGLSVAVNVSPRQLRQASFIDDIKGVLKRTRIAPELLEIELTESCLLLDVDQMHQVFSELRELGLSIAIDDFGTGYSSLAYLKDLPLSTLKIDRAFVCLIGVDLKGEAVVRTIAMLARNLELKVVAEGVETLEQQHFLQELNCDEAQGYYYYKPMPAAEISAALAAHVTD